ncbi:HNH endonuclease family protein [Arthrobacter sp. H20]|uniref:HNH endonuclease family protein n=1 Tax=Arthrobacter sp. H20 TaxID=1267981 RepID=UPI000565EE1C|nr:HNH endonuclease family protein [Arthrobacter sp. H20]
MRIKSALVSALTIGLLFTASQHRPAPRRRTRPTPPRSAVRALPVAMENNVRYDRNRHFGQWSDQSRDCQNTRAEVLISQSRVAPKYTATKRCTVATGKWITTFDNKTHTAASTVQIDHMVPVHEAWGSGARAWTQARRIAFYNDLGYAGSLNAQTSSLNSSKQASGPEQWMPPANQCSYIAQWTVVKARSGMTVDKAEKAALIAWTDKCAAVKLTITKA